MTILVPDPVTALLWSYHMGADDAVFDTAYNRSQAPDQTPLPASAPLVSLAPVIEAQTATLSPARTSAAIMPPHIDAANLTELAAQINALDLAINKTATHMIMGNGDPAARIMMVGDAPGADEDRTGQAFMGESGALLDKMLAAIGLNRTQLYLAHHIFWRPPGGRKPTEQEIATCLPYLWRLIELVNPDILVLLGDAACKTILQKPEGITRLRGGWFDITTPHTQKPIAVTALFHPAYLLRAPTQKALAWRDLLALKTRIADMAMAIPVV